jgi:hypothetical protein
MALKKHAQASPTAPDALESRIAGGPPDYMPEAVV